MSSWCHIILEGYCGLPWDIKTKKPMYEMGELLDGLDKLLKPILNSKRLRGHVGWKKARQIMRERKCKMQPSPACMDGKMCKYFAYVPLEVAENIELYKALNVAVDKQSKEE